MSSSNKHKPVSNIRQQEEILSHVKLCKTVNRPTNCLLYFLHTLTCASTFLSNYSPLEYRNPSHKFIAFQSFSSSVSASPLLPLHLFLHQCLWVSLTALLTLPPSSSCLPSSVQFSRLPPSCYKGHIHLDWAFAVALTAFWFEMWHWVLPGPVSWMRRTESTSNENSSRPCALAVRGSSSSVHFYLTPVMIRQCVMLAGAMLTLPLPAIDFSVFHSCHPKTLPA
jgi:hypothetical protein